MKIVCVILMIIVIAGCNSLQTPKLNPDMPEKIKPVQEFSYILIQDQKTGGAILFWRDHVVPWTIGGNTFKIFYHNHKITFANNKADYILALGLRILLTKEDYIRFLKWLMPRSTSVRFQKVKEERKELKGGKHEKNP